LETGYMISTPPAAVGTAAPEPAGLLAVAKTPVRVLHCDYT